MFQVDSGIDEEGGRLRSGRIFRPNKRRRTATRRDICSVTRRGDYELVPQLDNESCDEEQEYQLISKDKE